MTKLTKEAVGSFNLNEPVRLNKFIADSGYCSRKKADVLIEEGKVKINGETAALGTKVMPEDEVVIDGQVLKRKTELILIAFNKPKGIECTTAKDNPDNIIDFINYKELIYPIGRLDKNSRGLILLTNTGEIVNGILKSINYHEKEYNVKVNKPVTKEFLKQMQEGIYLKELKVKTRQCKITQTGKDTFTIILTQGLNRQIRRMCETLGYRVLDLERVRVMNIKLGNIPEGHYRNVTKGEIEKLLKDIEA